MLELATVRELDQAEALPAFDEDVQAAILEPREHVGHPRPRPDVTQPVVIGVDEPELAVRFEALADELLVALLEDVEGELLGRQKDDAEWKETELVHSDRLCGPVRQPIFSRSSAHELMQ